jgi:hypothetical protein
VNHKTSFSFNPVSDIMTGIVFGAFET